MENRRVSVRDIAEQTASGPFGSNIKSSEYVEAGVPVIRGINLSGPRFRADGFVFLTDEKAERLSSSAAFPNDIVFSARGTIGSVGIVPKEPFKKYVLSSNLIKLCVNTKKADPQYVFYYFRSPFGQNEIFSYVSTTGVPKIARALESLRRFEIFLPSLPEQRAIAHILGTLDDKIELNRRMSETLEAMARALFKSWFVDFDPVRAKAEGRDPGLPKHLADLFPDSFEDSELGEIPKGWGVVQLEALASIKGGKQLPTKDCKGTGSFPVFGANGVMGFADKVTHDGFVIAFGRVGAYCGSVHWTYRGAWINNNASSVVPDRWPGYVLQVMLEADFEELRTGSAQPFIPNGSLAGVLILRPPDTVLDAFSSLVAAPRLREQACQEECRSLGELRDALLPKLISGELRVKGSKL